MTNNSNFLESFSNPTKAVLEFLQSEKKAALKRSRQVEEFLSHKIEDIFDVPDIRQSLYDLRKKANTDLSSILRLLTLVR